MERFETRKLVAAGIFTVGALGALSVALAFAASESQNLFIILLRAPGAFFRDSFHIAAFYVPAILFVAGALLLRRSFQASSTVLLVLSTIPFLTAAAVIRLTASDAIELSPLTRSITAALGRPLALTTTSLLLAIELVGLYLLWTRTTGRDPFGADRREAPASRTSRANGDLTRGLSRISGLLEAPLPRKHETAAPVPASLTDLPEPPDEDETGDRKALSLTFVSGRFEDDELPDLIATPPEDDSDEADYTDEYDDARLPAGHDFSDGFMEQESRGGTPDSRAAAPSDDPTDDEDADDELDATDGLDIDTDDEDFDPELIADPEDADLDVDDLDGVDDAADAPARRPVPVPRSKRYDVPVDDLLDRHSGREYWHIDDKTREAAETLRVTLEEFGIQAEVTGIRKGPVITMFEILPAPGVKLSKIVNLSDNIALRLAAASVRIVAPIPGKHAVGIEIPNAERAIVGFAELLEEESFRGPQAGIPIALGKDIPGDAQIVDLTRMPHVLIAGATGSGKSVCVNSIICSILYRRAPHEVKLILIDPKIVELKFYNDIPHLLTPVITDPKRAFQALQYCIYEMERRYTLLDALQVRDVQSYNRKIQAKRLATEPLPYIVVVVDEFADLMATSGKELESTLARLAAMSRAVGIHLVLATQRPSTDVITGLIKANIPSRIAFMVASKVDSRIILDAMGADKLLGRGDMLFTSAWDPFPTRMQGAFLSDEEVERVVEYVKQLGEPDYIDDEIFVEDEDEDYAQGELEDPLMERAIEIVTTAGKASASYLQRRLKVGYNRAARMVEEMERMGLVGPQQGSKPREVIAGG